MSEDRDRVASALRDLPLPELDPAVAERALERARVASQVGWRPSEALVAILLLSAAGVFAIDTATKLARAFGL